MSSDFKSELVALVKVSELSFPFNIGNTCKYPTLLDCSTDFTIVNWCPRDDLLESNQQQEL